MPDDGVTPNHVAGILGLLHDAGDAAGAGG